MEFAMYTLFSEETQILLGCFGFKISGRSAGKPKKHGNPASCFFGVFPAGHPSKQLVDLAGLDNPLQVMCCRAPRKLMLGATWPWSRALPSCCVPTCRGPALHDGCGWWSREVAICGFGSFRSGWGVWLVQNKDTHETPVLSEKISS